MFAIYLVNIVQYNLNSTSFNLRFGVISFSFQLIIFLVAKIKKKGRDRSKTLFYKPLSLS